MGATTRIEWTQATWNPVTGCTPCSSGCDHCYAAAMAARFPQTHGYVYMSEAADPERGEPQSFGRVRFHPERLEQPLHWRRGRRVFVCSMGDLFHEDVPDEWICAVLDVIRACYARGYGHTFQILTKRPERMRDICRRVIFDPRGDGRVCLDEPGWSLFPQAGSGGLRNVWLGVTVCNQAEADAKLPVLLDTPAVLRFVSIEPMLGPVNLERQLAAGIDRNGEPWGQRSLGIDWVICGGETGPGARPMHPRWVRHLRDQCASVGLPFFFKSWGDWAPDCLCHYRRPHRSVPRPKPGPLGCMFHCGKARSGRLLDGREWSCFPEERP